MLRFIFAIAAAVLLSSAAAETIVADNLGNSVGLPLAGATTYITDSITLNKWIETTNTLSSNQFESTTDGLTIKVAVEEPHTPNFDSFHTHSIDAKVLVGFNQVCVSNDTSLVAFTCEVSSIGGFSVVSLALLVIWIVGHHVGSWSVPRSTDFSQFRKRWTTLLGESMAMPLLVIGLVFHNHVGGVISYHEPMFAVLLVMSTVVVWSCDIYVARTIGLMFDPELNFPILISTASWIRFGVWPITLVHGFYIYMEAVNSRWWHVALGLAFMVSFGYCNLIVLAKVFLLMEGRAITVPNLVHHCIGLTDVLPSHLSFGAVKVGLSNCNDAIIQLRWYYNSSLGSAMLQFITMSTAFVHLESPAWTLISILAWYALVFLPKFRYMASDMQQLGLDPWLLQEFAFEETSLPIMVVRIGSSLYQAAYESGSTTIDRFKRAVL